MFNRKTSFSDRYQRIISGVLSMQKDLADLKSSIQTRQEELAKEKSDLDSLHRNVSHQHTVIGQFLSAPEDNAENVNSDIS